MSRSGKTRLMMTVAQNQTAEKWRSQKNGATRRGPRCLVGIRCLDTWEKGNCWERRDERVGWGSDPTRQRSRRSQKNRQLENLLWKAVRSAAGDGRGGGEAGQCGPRKPREGAVPGGTGQPVLSGSRSGQTSR